MIVGLTITKKERRPPRKAAATKEELLRLIRGGTDKRQLLGTWQLRIGSCAQTFGAGFCGEIALRHSQELKTDHEFAHGCGTQEWRKKVRMEMPFGMFVAVGRALVKAHRVRK